MWTKNQFCVLYQLPHWSIRDVRVRKYFKISPSPIRTAFGKRGEKALETVNYIWILDVFLTTFFTFDKLLNSSESGFIVFTLLIIIPMAAKSPGCPQFLGWSQTMNDSEDARVPSTPECPPTLDPVFPGNLFQWLQQGLCLSFQVLHWPTFKGQWRFAHSTRTSSEITRTPEMSSSYVQQLKVMSLLVRAWQNMVQWRREWQTISAFFPWEHCKQYEKAKRYDTERCVLQVGRFPICYWGKVRNSSRKNKEAEPKDKWCPVVDVSGGEINVQWCKEQYCIGTWNVRSMNQGKLMWSSRRRQEWTLTF